jgi:hypothetical protein
MKGKDYVGEPCECNGGPDCACPDCDHVDCSYRDVKYPHVEVQLSGKDGNPYLILGKVKTALRQAKVPKAEVDAYLQEAMGSDYDHMLATTMRWVTVS